MKKFATVCLLMLAGLVLTFGQTPTGRLTGVVSGPDGVLPSATVTVKFNVTGKVQTAVTDSDGSFSFAQLEPGEYTVTVTANGFKTFTANQLKIDIGREYTLTPTLEVGSVQESVTVTAGADVITSTTAQITATVSPQQILALPLITRDPLNLTTLQAGVASNPAQNTSINGMRTTMTNITRDGISINDAFIRTNATDFAPGRPSVDDTGEFTLSTSNQEADLGSGGAQIILVTPRGTKDFHGALFAYNRNSAFAANNFFNNRAGRYVATDANVIAGRNAVGDEKNPRPFRNRNQYGGKIGGPMPFFRFGEGGSPFSRNRAFFFFAYEGIKDPLSARATRTILTPSARAGTFTFNRATAGDVINGGGISCPSGAVGSVCTVNNLLTFAQGLGFAGIPSTVNPISQARILDVLPTQGNATGGDSLNTTGYAFNRRQDTTRETYTNRIDFDATEKDTVNTVFNWNKENVLRPDVDITGFDESPDVTQYSKNKSFTIAYRRILNSNMVNEVRWGIFTNEVPFKRISPYPSYFIGPSGTTSTTLAGIITQPDNIFLDQGRNNKVYTFADNFNWNHGKHSFKFGGQYQLYKVNSYNDVLIVPNYIVGTTSVTAATNTTMATSNFANVVGGVTQTSSLINTTQLATGNGLLAILAGLVNSGTQGFNTTSPTSGYQVARNLSPYRNTNEALYVSDRWQVTRDLTVNLGVRWEIFPALRLNNGLALEPVVNENDLVGSLTAGNGSFNVIGTTSGEQYTYYKTDYNNFAPTIGVAYTPNFEKGIGNFLFGAPGRSVFRGGYSHVYGNDSIITTLANTLSGNVGLGRATSSPLGPTGTTSLNDRLGGNLTAISAPVFVAPPRTYLQNNTATQGFFGVSNAVDPNLQVPKTEQYSVGFQREFWGNTAFEVRYVGTRSDNLTRGVELNQIDVVKNGFLADFKKAQQNLALSGTPFCNPAVTAGCQTLNIFQNGGTGSAGRLAVGTGVTLTQFISDLRAGIVADLAQRFITNNINNHPSVASPNNVPFVKFYQNPYIGQIQLFTNDGYYNYNSLQMEIRRRFTQGLYFQANYTFSKNLTNTIGTGQNQFEPYLLNEDKALDVQRADFDQTHVFNFNGIYALPFGKGKMFLNHGGWVDKVFGGWELSGTATWSSGTPITFIDGRGTINRGVRSGRQTPFSTLTNDQIRDLSGVTQLNGNLYYLNPAIINTTTGQGSVGYINPSNSNAAFAGQVFFNVEAGQTGNVSRSLINGPRYHNINASLMKNINFSESMRLQIRAEAFNLLNKTVFSNGVPQLASITSATFGQITAAQAARQVQFALRFEF